MTIHSHPIRCTGLAALLLGLSGCAAWLPDAQRIDVQQGNVLDPEAVQALEPGQSRERVRELLGEPILDTPFHADRWDYVYFLTKQGRDAETQRLTLLFGPQGLESVAGDYRVPDDPVPEVPTGPLPDAERPAPAGGGPGGGGGPSPTPGPTPGPG